MEVSYLNIPKNIDGIDGPSDDELENIEDEFSDF
jgi:hypothetical protein